VGTSDGYVILCVDVKTTGLRGEGAAALRGQWAAGKAGEHPCDSSACVR